MGGSYALLDGEPYWQAYGILSNKSHGIRFDVGVEWQKFTYTADFTHNNHQLFNFNEYGIDFIQIHSQEAQINPFVALTLNGTSKTSFINLFLQAAVVRQTFFYISDAPPAFACFNHTHETHHIYPRSPRVSIPRAETGSVILGVPFIWDASMESNTTTTFQPLLQFDIGL